MNELYNMSHDYSLEGIMQFFNKQFGLMKARDQEMMKEKAALNDVIAMWEKELTMQQMRKKLLLAEVQALDLPNSKHQRARSDINDIRGGKLLSTFDAIPQFPEN